MYKSCRKVYATAYEFQQLYDMPIKKLRIGIIHEEKKFSRAKALIVIETFSNAQIQLPYIRTLLTNARKYAYHVDSVRKII